MYVEQLPGMPNGDWVRACIRLPFNNNSSGTFESTLRTVLSLGVSVHKLALSVRIQFDPGSRCLDRFLLLVAPLAEEKALRRFTAAFSRLELAGGRVEFPSNARHFQELWGTFPRWRTRASVPAQGNGSPWFLPDHSILPGLERLILLAQSLGVSFSYQSNLWPFTPESDFIRKCSRNLLKIENLTGVPESLVAMQRRIEQRVRQASYVAEEYVGVPDQAAAKSLSDCLDEMFEETHRELKFPPAEFWFAESGFDDWIESGFHTSTIEGISIPDSWIDACTPDRVSKTVLWSPGRALEFAVPRGKGMAVEREGASMPVASAVRRDGYVFVSYSRSDKERVLPLLERLEQAGIPYWYDQHIPGGAEWIETLEERIQSCSAIVLMLSPSSVESKYVRRELGYADSVGKPILTVELQQTELRHGLGLRLGQSQIIAGNPAAITSALGGAIASINGRRAS